MLIYQRFKVCFLSLFLFLKEIIALLRWLSWLEHRSIHQKVGSSILGQGTCLGCGFDP